MFAMSDKFNDSGKKVFYRAIEESRLRGHNFLAMEHIFMALCQIEGELLEDAAEVARVSTEAIRLALDDELTRCRPYVGRRMYIADTTRDLFNRALKTAHQSDERQIAPSHLLIALFADPKGDQASILRQLGADPGKMSAAATLISSRRSERGRQLEMAGESKRRAFRLKPRRAARKIKIGIIGAGKVGSVLGNGWSRNGHRVMFGVRDLNYPKVDSVELQATGRCGSIQETVSFAEVIVLAVPFDAVHDLLKSVNGIEGKILFDATNPFTPDFSSLPLGHATSGAEQIAQWAPGARIVKIFHATGSSNPADLVYHGRKISMLYCGDDLEAKASAAALATDLDFGAIDAGPLSHARMLWMYLDFHGLQPDPELIRLEH